MYNRSKQNTQDRQLTVPGRLGMTSKFTKKKCFYWILKIHKSGIFGREKFLKVSPNSEKRKAKAKICEIASDSQN